MRGLYQNAQGVCEERQGRCGPAIPDPREVHLRKGLADPLRQPALPQDGRAVHGGGRFHGHLPARRPGGHGDGPHPFGHLHPAQFRQEGHPHRRRHVRRRTEEIHLFRFELSAAAAGRSEHALLLQRRFPRRRGPFLRPFRHGQDHPFGRPEAGPRGR